MMANGSAHAEYFVDVEALPYSSLHPITAFMRLS